MSENIHELLDECKVKAETLVSEIEKYKAATEVNKAATESLEKTSQALTDVIDRITPFTDVKFRRFQMTVLVWLFVNSALLIAILIMVVLRKG